MQSTRLSRPSIVRLTVTLLAGCGFIFPGQAALGQVEPAPAGPFRTQTIALEAGWNAVYLEVQPLDSDPTALFAGTPVGIVAAYLRPVTPLEFVNSPGEILPDRKGWNVWYAPEREDALLSNLYSVQAHHAYLVYSEVEYTLQIAGIPYSGSVKWHPNAYSLVGFPVNLAEQPTLTALFAGSEAHEPLKLYQMVDGKWVFVTNPEQVLLQPGKAYWVYTEGATSFPGPFEVRFANQAAGGLIFGDGSPPQEIVLTNKSSFPQELTLQLQAGTAGALSLAYQLDAVNGPNEPIETLTLPFPETLEIGPLEAGQSFSLSLDVVQSRVTQPVLGANLIITSDAGLRHDVPIISIRRDLIEP